ncbi:hypothetical protein AVEN_157657-1 [Araneus ventricosus]|uniref:Uncharacterized protein n=1 Tax=Araneus ventricosus TaxID=182803 RepID=A0A4Y1ZL46_ARAVE|nr:hypothetical protein AVEN_157657-1 [Araneus ventricosus]
MAPLHTCGIMWSLLANHKPIFYAHLNPLLLLLLPADPISSTVTEPHSSLDISTRIDFPHLWPGSPNRSLGYPDKLNIQTSESTAPILIDFSH